jgi:uncharacterized ferritin-like protein (DUF455 family)
MSDAPPPEGTLDRWAFDYVRAGDLATKLERAPVSAPLDPSPVARVIDRPGRPPELVVVTRAAKSPGPEALRSPERRAQLAHTFFHHELQAAELMAWALLAFPDAPPAFRRGLARIADDEIRHMALYRDYLRALGSDVGAFPVRDWFWQRVPSAQTPLAFVSVMGIGFEGGNLDHTARFAARFRAIGDEEGARLQERIGEEEIPHVAFALHWFERWTGTTELGAWADALPAPLSPLVMRGDPLNRADPRRAGMTDGFLDELERWTARAPGS